MVVLSFLRNFCNRGGVGTGPLTPGRYHCTSGQHCYDQFAQPEEPEVCWVFWRLTSSFSVLFTKGELNSSLVAQRLKRLPTMRETQVRSLDREDPLEEGGLPCHQSKRKRSPYCTCSNGSGLGEGQ